MNNVDVLHALDTGGFRAGNPRFQGEASVASRAIAGTARQVGAEAEARPAQVALPWGVRPAGRLGVHLAPVPGTRHPRWLEVNVAPLGMHPRCRPLRYRERRAHRLIRQTWPVPGSRNEDAETAMNQLNLNDARCEALFASGLQRSERPAAQAAAEAISRAVRRFGIRGCAGRMAQEFGDHPQAAAERMRWARQVVVELTARAHPSPEPHCQSPNPVRASGPGDVPHSAARRTGCAGTGPTRTGRLSPPRAGISVPHAGTRSRGSGAAS